MAEITGSAERLRGLLAGESCVRPASVFDPASARIAASLGFEAGMLAGSVASAVVLGAPDLVVMTSSELADQVRRITRACDLPLLVDADHGYGNALNARRTVEELAAAGAAGLTLEDTVLPPPFRETQRSLVPVAEMLGKLRSAVAARGNSSTVIVGRTTVRSPEGLEGAAARVAAYQDTGVDAIFLAGARSRDEVIAIRAATRLPLVLGIAPPELGDPAFLNAQGVKMAFQGHRPFYAAVNAVHAALRHLREGGDPAAVAGGALSDDLRDTILDGASYAKWERDYLE